jgi:thioredoxin reductase (NADPH)
VGFSPDNQLVPLGIKVSPSGYVITDEKCEPSIPGIFAPGGFRQKYASQIVIAAADGCTAALAAAHYVVMNKASALCFGTAAEVSAGSA